MPPRSQESVVCCGEKCQMDLYAPTSIKKRSWISWWRFFPKFLYANIKHVSWAIWDLSKNVKQHYVIGILGNIFISFVLFLRRLPVLRDSTPQTTAGWIVAGRSTTHRATWAERQAMRSAERIQQEQAQWTKSVFDLNDSVLAFAESSVLMKITRTAIVKDVQSAISSFWHQDNWNHKIGQRQVVKHSLLWALSTRFALKQESPGRGLFYIVPIRSIKAPLIQRSPVPATAQFGLIKNSRASPTPSQGSPDYSWWITNSS